MTEFKAIETTYKGYRFRSRLEARWAVFFETMGYIWRYEHEGYERGGKRYLPDFEIDDGPERTFFVEVKGDPRALIKDHERFVELLDWGGCLPNFDDCYDTKATGLLLLGEIPDAELRPTHFHSMIQHHEGLHRRWFTFGPKTHVINQADENWLSALCNIHPEHCIEGDPDKWLVESRAFPGTRCYLDVRDAYVAARKARFEHGETPR